MSAVLPATEPMADTVASAASGGEASDHLALLLPEAAVPLGYVRDGPTVFLIARERSARWPVSVLRNGTARLRLPEGVHEGRVELVTAPDAKRAVLDRFLTRYGPERFARWYDRPARILSVQLDAAPAPAASNSPGYYDWLVAEFDNVADDYDHHITGNRINLLLRNRSLAHLREVFRGAPRLLEIGCGSGMETLPLLEEGHELFCVDISERMLDVVRTKARAAGVQERLTTRRGRAGRLADVLADAGPEAFDGAYSTYGALNCEEDLRPVPAALRDHLRADGRFVAGVYNRWCLFELVGYTLSGQPSRALGRTRRPVPVGSSRFCVDIFAHSVGDFERLFGADFSVDRVEAVPILLPPSDLVGYAERFSRHFDRLAGWDRTLGAAWPFRYFGDHFLMTFRRRSPPSTRPAAVPLVAPSPTPS